MRLHSDHKDYYDMMQRGDLDPLPRYVRDNTAEHVLFKDKARMAALAPLPVIFKRMPRCSNIDVPVYTCIIGLCGKLIPVYRILERDYGTRHGFPMVTYRSFTDLPSVLVYLRALPDPTDHNERLSHRRMLKALDDEAAKGPVRWTNQPSFSVKGWEHWLQMDGRLLTGEHDELFRLIDAPVFVWRGKSRRLDLRHQFSNQDSGMVLERNPVLRNLGWQRHDEPFSVWQSIDQYLGNQMAKQEDPLPLSDELRRDAHGFDDRSFKTDAPGRRKARRRANKARKRNRTDD